MLIDLHMHTTASDGTCSPRELVQLAAMAGLNTIGIADHDTMAAVPAVCAAAAELGIEVVAGIEVTSVWNGRDVHVLGYNLDNESQELRQVLEEQRGARAARAREIASRLARVGAPIDIDALIASAPPNAGKALARPQIARALIAAGHVQDVAEAFERFLGPDGPAYVPHRGASPMDVVGVIARAGGLSSLAHPGTTRVDELLDPLVEAGLDAIEAYHSAHDADDQARYRLEASRRGLLVTGGSDFHGPSTRRSEFFGKTVLPENEYFRFRDALAGTRRVS